MTPEEQSIVDQKLREVAEMKYYIKIPLGRN